MKFIPGTEILLESSGRGLAPDIFNLLIFLFLLPILNMLNHYTNLIPRIGTNFRTERKIYLTITNVVLKEKSDPVGLVA